MKVLLGLEVTPSVVRAVSVDAETGAITGAVSRPLGVTAGRRGWAEQPAEDLLAATAEALAEAGAKTGRSGVAAVGIAGGRHATLLCDETHTPVRDVLIAPSASPSSGTDAALEWIRAREPEVFGRIRHVLTPKDYLGLWLTGELGTDSSSVVWRDPAEPPTASTPAEWFPPAGESSSILGRVREAASTASGIAPGTPVVRGSSLACASAIGSGVVRKNRSLVSMDPSALVITTVDEPPSASSPNVCSSRHALPGRFAAWSALDGALDALEWYRRVLCDGERLAGELRSEDLSTILLDAASTSRPGAGGLVFLPPGNASDRGTPLALVGSVAHASKADVSRAVIEGVTIRAARALFDLASATRRRANGVGNGAGGDGAVGHAGELRAAGRVASNPFWRQLLADITAMPVSATTAQGCAYGAALLSAVAAGVDSTVEDAADRLIFTTARSAPDPTTSARYTDLVESFGEIEAHLGEIDSALCRLR